MGVNLATELLLDTKPIPVLSYKRNKKHSDFAGKAGYGVCASRNMKYFGFKLVALTTLDGIPVVYELGPANTDERAAAEEVLDSVWGCDIFGDKGFIGEEWQLDQETFHGNRIWTAKRANQSKQNAPEFDLWLNSIRERGYTSLYGELPTFRLVQNNGNFSRNQLMLVINETFLTNHGSR